MAQICVKFEQGDTIYAESKEPPFSFEDIVGIDLGSGQTHSLEEIVLPVDVTLGTTKFRFGKDDYELLISSVRVWLDKTNCHYQPGTRYGGGAPEIETVIKSGVGIIKKTTWGTNVKTLLGLEKQDISLGVDAGRIQTSTSDDALSIEQTIPLATTEGAHAVRVTLPDGLSGGLTGTVVSAVAKDGSLTPFCHLNAKDLDQSVTGRIRVQVRPSDMHLRRVTKAKRGTPTVKINEAGLRDHAKALAAREADEDQRLRDKVAELALIMPVSRDPGQHVDLATKGFCFYPRFDEYL